LFVGGGDWRHMHSCACGRQHSTHPPQVRAQRLVIIITQKPQALFYCVSNADPRNVHVSSVVRKHPPVLTADTHHQQLTAASAAKSTQCIHRGLCIGALVSVLVCEPLVRACVVCGTLPQPEACADGGGQRARATLARTPWRHAGADACNCADTAAARCSSLSEQSTPGRQGQERTARVCVCTYMHM
jgi:hypothetical protein